MSKGKTDRNAPKRAPSSESRYSLMEFEREFPDDVTCLDYLVGKLYPDGIHCPKCGKVTKHHRLRNRPAYSCQFCGRHEYPLKGTIFQGSSTSLYVWFRAIYLMASTRCGISAKQLERETGVTYPTAHRMFKQIRSLLGQEGEAGWFGTVEMDDAYFGGRPHWKHRNRIKGTGRATDRPPVFGMAKRAGDGEAYGKVWAKAVTRLDQANLEPEISQRIRKGSRVISDEFKTYDALRYFGYHHDRIKHSDRVYVSGDVHTQTIEGFWSLVKRGVNGVYHGVSSEYLQAYLDEYVFRYNNREATGRGMFDAFLSRVRKASGPAS
jgi:transposase